MDLSQDTWLVMGDNKVAYTADTLLGQFIGKLQQIDDKRIDQDLLVLEIIKNLPHENLAHITIENLVSLGFKIGYIYRIFLEKNNVQLPAVPHENTDEISG